MLDHTFIKKYVLITIIGIENIGKKEKLRDSPFIQSHIKGKWGDPRSVIWCNKRVGVWRTFFMREILAVKQVTLIDKNNKYS